jgi:hypothetical protein
MTPDADRLAIRAVTALGLALLLACACGGGGDGGPDPDPDPDPVPVASVTVTPATATVGVGAAVPLSATLRGAAGELLTGRAVEWTSGDEAIAVVTDAGIVTGVAAGTTGVTATSEGVSGQASVTVTATPPPTSANFALAFTAATFTGNDLGRVKIPLDAPARPVDVGATDFTVEFWIRAQPGANPQGSGCGSGDPLDWIGGNIVLDRDRAGQGRKWGLSLTGGRVTFGYSTTPDTQGRSICGGPRVDDGAWHHVAVTRRVATGALALFIDGAQAATATGPAGDISHPDGALGATNDPFLVLGAEKHDVGPQFPGFTGQLDELRLSTTVRYAAAFTRPARRFTPDAQTAALYHFDEGTGLVLGDAGGAAGGPSDGRLNVGGAPAGPTWVASTAPTGD